MSLIHEALKRADEEKGERLGGVTPPGPPAADDGPPSRPSPGRLVITVGAVLAAGRGNLYPQSYLRKGRKGRV